MHLSCPGYPTNLEQIARRGLTKGAVYFISAARKRCNELLITQTAVFDGAIRPSYSGPTDDDKIVAFLHNAAKLGITTATKFCCDPDVPGVREREGRAGLRRRYGRTHVLLDDPRRSKIWRISQ